MAITVAAPDDSAEELEVDLDSLSQGEKEGSKDFEAEGRFPCAGRHITLDSFLCLIG